MASLSDEISSRRTFAIISHPDAGKTTLTEKLLLYTGSIQTAGSVKGKSSAKHAVSDWMDIEKERGISVTSSVLQFTYNGACVNILDTPGHQDFSEDTYRTLMAADAAVMVIDGAKGVEAQTKKLFKVCTLRHIPIFTFVNKLDHEARDPFELMEEIENVLGINTYPMNWPIGSGRNFRGVFDRQTRRVIAFEGDGHANATKKVAEVEAELGDAYTDYTVAVQTGESAPNVAGIVKTGDYSMTVTLTEVNATAIYQLPVTVCPMHYYGETDKYDYDNNMFGFVKGDLSHVKSVTSTPVGSGPYTFEGWSNGAVTLQKNPTYWKGEPKIDTVIWREMQDEDKIPGVVSGTIDVTDPSYSKEAAEQIKEANSNGEISGDTIQTDLVANLGYGYVGFNANRVKIGDGNGGDEASKDLRKAIATVIAVYRDVAVDSYYGEFANVINYPISDTSWAAPRVTDEGYKVAFSVDVNGNDIYTEGMSADDKYAAAKQAALGYFEAAGYTVADGKITAAPAGGRMDAEVMVGGSGKGDHPSFMALTLASDALKEIGFNLIVSDMSNFAEMTNAINAGTADMFAMAWQATPDPDMFQIYHSQGGSNEKSYWIKDADLDELIMMARQSTDQTYRKTLYKQCLDIVADWAVEIPIYQRQNCVIFSAKRVNLDTVTPDITTYWTWYNDIELLDLQ